MAILQDATSQADRQPIALMTGFAQTISSFPIVRTRFSIQMHSPERYASVGLPDHARIGPAFSPTPMGYSIIGLARMSQVFSLSSRQL
jgi:hypothetical protein